MTGNVAPTATGGGICVQAGDVGLEYCTLSRNVAQDGGGIAVLGISHNNVYSTILWGNCVSGRGQDMLLESTGYIAAGCCAIDSTGIAGARTPEWHGVWIKDDPLLCDMSRCGDAPTTEGSFQLAADSPCLAGLCGRIGAAGEGCTQTPVARTSWGKIRSGFR